MKSEIYTPNERLPDGSLPLPSLPQQKKIPFWSENPNILFDPHTVFEFFPIDTMTYEQKLNSLSRTIILCSLIGFAFSYNIRILLIGGCTLFVLFLFYSYSGEGGKEGLENPVQSLFNAKKKTVPQHDDVFQTPESTNPFGNVLMTDYDYNPHKKPAPPSFDEKTNSQIIEQTKQMIRDAHPGQPDITEKLYKDLGEQMMFEHSLGHFYSTPSTTIPNDQNAFAHFAYGDMISNKEGNPFSAVRQMPRYTNY